MVRSFLRTIERNGRRAAMRSELSWRHLVNLGPTRAFRRVESHLEGEATRVLTDLDRDGVAITSLDALLDEATAAALYHATEAVRRDAAADVQAARARLQDPPPGTAKPYVVALLEGGRRVPPELERFALDPRILAVVHGYFQMFVSLRYYDIWHTLRSNDAPTQSQLWHRDPEDRHILKVFVALESIDDGSGPFTYATGSHAKGNARGRPAYLHKDGPTGRSSDEQMAEVVPRDRWVEGTGPRGTMIFADTRGYHRGGLARTRDRVVFVSQYLSRAGGREGISTAPGPRRTH